MTLLRSAVLLAAIALSATAVRAQDARLASRLDPEVHAAIAPIIEAAHAAGLPVEPLIVKALEGATKRASGVQIANAVRALGRDLGAARSALGAQSSDPELIAGAGALKAGAPPEALQRLRAVRPRSALTIPLATLADLIAHGVPVDTAAAAVLALAGSAATDADFLALRRDVERDIGVGVAPAAAASVRARSRPPAGVPAGKPAGVIITAPPVTPAIKP